MFPFQRFCIVPHPLATLGACNISERWLDVFYMGFSVIAFIVQGPNPVPEYQAVCQPRFQKGEAFSGQSVLSNLYMFSASTAFRQIHAWLSSSGISDKLQKLLRHCLATFAMPTGHRMIFMCLIQTQFDPTKSMHACRWCEIAF